MKARPEWLLRLFVPSWRFFEAEDARFVLESRVARAGGAPSTFAPAVPAAPRGLHSLVFAPEHNFHLFAHDAIERLVHELGERGPLAYEDVEKLPSYARVRDLARHFLSAAHGAAPSTSFQLRLCALDEGEHTQELFLSPPYPLER